MNDLRFTVFTPTYNRGYIIENLYRSLQRQTYKNFEWVVIDDGSSDNTEELFRKWTMEENDFKITYQKTENGGKHRAINRGLKIAKGELFFIADSDDYLTDNALEISDKVEKSIPEKEKKNFAGVCGRDGFSPAEPVGTSFHGKEYLDITSLERKKHKIEGDKKEIFYTEVLRKYPFPEFEGEKFLTENIVWSRIAHDGYKLRFFNDIIYICDYLPDGLSVNASSHFVNSPKGLALNLTQSVDYGIFRGIDKWNEIYSYYGSFRGKLPVSEIANNLNMNVFSLAVRIFGMKIFYKIYK